MVSEGAHYVVVCGCVVLMELLTLNTSNNMLYPKEDKEHNMLLYECRICSYVEQAANPRVYRHELISNIG